MTLAAALLGVSLLFALAAHAATDDTVLISRASGAGADNSNGHSADISADGRYVAFVSGSADLNPDAEPRDLTYLRDTVTNETILVSRHDGANGAAAGDASIGAPSVSADGRYVAFVSSDVDLDDDFDVNLPGSPVQGFVRDVVADETILISRGNGPSGTAADSAVGAVSIADGGRFASFVTSDDLGTGSGASMNAFRRDIETQETLLISRADGPGGTAAEVSFSNGTTPLSADGRFAVFTSDDDSLDDGAPDTDTNTDAYLRDVETGQTTLVSRADGPDGTVAGASATADAISEDGSRVVFGTSTKLAGADDNGIFDVYVRDVETGSTTLVSRAAGADGEDGDGASTSGDISPDGRFVSFSSEADNFSTEDDNSVADVFLRDLQTDSLRLISRASGAGGVGANGFSIRPSVARDGGYVAFQSSADNLSADDDDSDPDVYRRELGESNSPAAPVLTGTNPASPADENAPLLLGAAEPAASVEVFTTPGCSGAPVATGSADSAGRFAISVSVADNSTTILRATARDAFGNTSPCSPDSVTYVESSSGGPDTEVDDPDVSAKKKQRQGGKKIKIKVKVSAGEPVSVIGKGKIKIKKGKKGKKGREGIARVAAKPFKLKRQKKSIDGGQATVLRLKPKKKKDHKKILKLLARGKDLRANPSVKFTDLAGNTVTQKRVVRLKPKR